MAEARAKKIFERYLGSKGLRMTRQRGLIVDIFLRKEGHMSPEDLYALVRARDATVGRATVYRVLKLLKAAGLAREVDFGEGVARYEHKWGHAHHDHLVCTRCGRTTEVVDDEIEALQERLAKRHGFALLGHRMDLYGLCPSCLKKRK